MTRGFPPFAIMFWGQIFTNPIDIYHNSPIPPEISEQGFIGRIRKRLKVVGYLTEEFVLHALYTGTSGYEGGGGVYFGRQKSTGFVYYGISDCPEERIGSHFSYYTRRRSRLHIAMAEAGPSDFQFSIMFQGNILRADLMRIERALIELENTRWPNGFNDR